MTSTTVRTVLIADDDPDIRALLTMNLELSGYSVAAAENGGQAAELARTLLPDLIVLDVMMPVTDGLDLLAALKSDEHTMHIPVVMLTARSSDDDVWAGWAAGAAYYMTKPFDPEHLLQFIEYLGDTEKGRLPGYAGPS